ncbi:Protein MICRORCHIDIA 1 [Bienertia sinuspersici]
MIEEDCWAVVALLGVEIVVVVWWAGKYRRKRCEEHVQKEHELKQTVSKLEKELDEARNKCAQLAAYLENRKKQQSLMQQVGHA